MTVIAATVPTALTPVGVIGCNPTPGDTALATLRASGVTVGLTPDGNLRLTPKEAVTEQVRALVAEHRPGIVQALQTQPAGLLRLWALVGEECYFVDDDTSMMPVHCGVAVYTASEREVIKQRRWEQHLVKRFHGDRTKLMSVWPGWGWVSESEIDNLCKRKGLLRGDAQEVLNVLCDAGLMCAWVAHQYPIYSLLGPSGRKRKRQFDAGIISREIWEQGKGASMLQEDGDDFGGD